MSGVARADGMLPNNGAIVFEKVYINNELGEAIEPPEPDDTRFYLNAAHCECSKAKAGMEQVISYDIRMMGAATGNTLPAEIWVGSDCGNDTTRSMNCKKIEPGIRDLNATIATPERISVSLFDIINVKDEMGACRKTEGVAAIWILVDTNGQGPPYEYFISQAVATTATNMDVGEVDTQEPPQPTDFRAESGEGSVIITWTPPTSGATDIFLYQALCADADGMPLQGISPPDARFQTTNMVCQTDTEFALTEAQTIGDGAPITAVLPEFLKLNRDYVCGEALGTASSLTVDGLANDQSYQVAIVVVDQYGNFAGSAFNRMVVPKPVTDFWEDLHDRNSAVDGGCLLAKTYGDGSGLTHTLRAFRDNTLAKTVLGRALIDAYYGSLGKLSVESAFGRAIAGVLLAPLVVLALLWHFLSLPILLALALLPFLWRKRRLLVALFVIAPAVASADDFQPYWETEEDSDASLLEFQDVKWHAGIRLGPYVPDIDRQAGLNAANGKGPYEAMFGQDRVWQVLPMLDVDRVLWNGWGQLMVGGSIGYMQKSARTYKDGTSEDDDPRERSSSKNTFRLVPTAASITYRFTLLDDMWGIPVVPYVRGGLDYYMWWIKAPNGDVSKVCEEVAADMTCAKEDKAYGGSLGFHGSVGIAIRAERVDNDAAISMRASGIKHAGFYAELQYAKVDGFGSDSKLSVGDNTWFAGVNFEF
jgi:hypothetical protein